MGQNTNIRNRTQEKEKKNKTKQIQTETNLFSHSRILQKHLTVGCDLYKEHHIHRCMYVYMYVYSKNIVDFILYGHLLLCMQLIHNSSLFPQSDSLTETRLSFPSGQQTVTVSGLGLRTYVLFFQLQDLIWCRTMQVLCMRSVSRCICALTQVIQRALFCQFPHSL